MDNNQSHMVILPVTLLHGISFRNLLHNYESLESFRLWAVDQHRMYGKGLLSFSVNKEGYGYDASADASDECQQNAMKSLLVVYIYGMGYENLSKDIIDKSFEICDFEYKFPIIIYYELAFENLKNNNAEYDFKIIDFKNKKIKSIIQAATIPQEIEKRQSQDDKSVLPTKNKRRTNNKRQAQDDKSVVLTNKKNDKKRTKISNNKENISSDEELDEFINDLFTEVLNLSD